MTDILDSIWTETGGVMIEVLKIDGQGGATIRFVEHNGSRMERVLAEHHVADWRCDRLAAIVAGCGRMKKS